jgi:hypothetical protein
MQVFYGLRLWDMAEMIRLLGIFGLVLLYTAGFGMALFYL